MFEGIDDYWKLREEKLEKQAQKPETDIFKNCVFYILGYVGRGEKSRHLLAKRIEKNGGRNTFIYTSSVTHIITNNLCKRKRVILDKDIENRKVFVVKPCFIDECIKEGKLLSPDKFMSSKQNAKKITDYLQESKN